MKLSIQGTPIENSDMPYANQMKSLLETGPVATIKARTGHDITFFGEEAADLLFFFSIEYTSWNPVDDDDDDDCECKYCRDYDGSTNLGACEYEMVVFEAADFEEIARIRGDGCSFVKIAQNIQDASYSSYDLKIDFIIGMKSELSDNIIGLPLSGSISQGGTELSDDLNENLQWLSAS